MKKMSLMKKIGLTALASVIAASFVGCPAGPQEEKEPVYKVIFDPAAEETYDIYYESDTDPDADPVLLVKGEDYEIVDGNLVITPNGWGTVIVLKEEVEAKGAEVTLGGIAVDATGKAKMGVNLMSSVAVHGYSGEIAVDPSTKFKEYKGTFGAKYTGTDWSTTPQTTYKGQESVVRIQPYVQGGEADGWGATTDVEVTLGPITVYNAEGLAEHNKEIGGGDVVSDVLDEIMMKIQETVNWTGASSESVEIKKDTASAVFEITGLSMKAVDAEAGTKNEEGGIVNLYIQTVDGTEVQWTAADDCIYTVESVEMKLNDSDEYVDVPVDSDLEGAKGLKVQEDGSVITNLSFLNPWWHDCVTLAETDVINAVKVTISVAVK